MQLSFKMRKGGCINHSTKTDHVEQPTLQEISSKNLHKPCSSNNKGPIYEEQRLQIEELDEWRTQKPRKPDKPKLSQDELNTSPNQLKVGEKVLLDEANPRITTSEPNEEIPLTVLSIFPYGIVEVIHPKFKTFKGRAIRPCENRAKIFPNTGCDKLPWPCDKYRLVQSTEEENPEGITDDIPPRHEDPPSHSPPIHRLVHAAASYSDISERLTRFEQQCFQCFNHIDATLHQICQYLHILSPPPPREPSGDDDI
ncbi:hypothetical protein GOBAR_AA13671 [Gossypium barbadense]|uniref:Uncharacterized protein n=1 Tax=Gossypium barbadense TaxID=3634 RepID=A0A2P5XUF7_GOSBA|nr:hypothetical protein GOBAR_AA13671 [Gossypium barbadense]